MLQVFKDLDALKYKAEGGGDVRIHESTETHRVGIDANDKHFM